MLPNTGHNVGLLQHHRTILWNLKIHSEGLLPRNFSHAETSSSTYHMPYKNSAFPKNNIQSWERKFAHLKQKCRLEWPSSLLEDKTLLLHKQLFPLCIVSEIKWPLPGLCTSASWKLISGLTWLLALLTLWNPKEKYYKLSKIQPLYFSESDRICIPTKNLFFWEHKKLGFDSSGVYEGWIAHCWPELKFCSKCINLSEASH